MFFTRKLFKMNPLNILVSYSVCPSSGVYSAQINFFNLLNYISIQNPLLSYSATQVRCGEAYLLLLPGVHSGYE
jgi:hypothetical protein